MLCQTSNGLLSHDVHKSSQGLRDASCTKGGGGWGVNGLCRAVPCRAVGNSLYALETMSSVCFVLVCFMLSH